MCLQRSLGDPVPSTFVCQSPFFLAVLRSGTGCVEGHNGTITFFLLLGSVLGSFIIEKPSQHFFGERMK